MVDSTMCNITSTGEPSGEKERLEEGNGTRSFAMGQAEDRMEVKLIRARKDRGA